MDDKEIVEEFGQLQNSASRSKAARLRDLHDHIEALRRRGFSRATIIEAMKKHGLEFDLKSFADTLYRIRKERANSLAKPARIHLEAEIGSSAQAKIDSGDKRESNVMTIAPQKQPASWINPLHALSRTPKEGDFNHIPKAKFEVDES